MTTLADLTPDRWTPVARRIQTQDGLDAWQWVLSLNDRNALHLAREAGDVITVQKRDERGFVLLAKLTRRGPKRVDPIDFALAGMGMFEQ